MSDVSAARRYLTTTHDLLARLLEDGWPSIASAADLVASALEHGGTLHTFGTGHSHMLAEELYYRAGGLVRVKPILFEGLMLHASAPLGTSLERLPGLAAALLDDHSVVAGDVLMIASNSGGNAVTCELAQLARSAGVRVVAITSLRHATSLDARSSTFPRLHELADVTVDNGGCVGDAAIRIDGFVRAVGPTSTVVGAAIVNAIAVGAIERLVARGLEPDVYTSNNVKGGDEANAHLQQAGGGA